jgi:hypothetical protein
MYPNVTRDMVDAHIDRLRVEASDERIAAIARAGTRRKAGPGGYRLTNALRLLMGARASATD